MQKLIFFGFFTGLLSLLAACGNKEPLVTPPPPPPIDTQANFKVLWQTPLQSDTGQYTAWGQVVTDGGNIIYSINWTSPLPTVGMRNGETGALIWEQQFPSRGFLNDNFYNINNKIVISDWSETQVWDVASGSVDWAYKVPESGYGMVTCNVINDQIYKVVAPGGPPYNPSSTLLRTHYQSNQWDTVLTLNYENDGFFINMYPPVLWINPQGDSILVFQEGGLRESGGFNGGKNRASVYAYNLRSRQLEWVRKNIDPAGGITTAKPLVDGDRLYINGVRTLHCFDLNTGNTIWQKEFPEAIMDGNITVYKNTLMVPSTQIGMWGVDKQTGSILWYNKDVDGNVLLVVQFDGIVYCTSTGYARLYAVNAETGATIWKENSPNRNSRHPNASFAFAGIAIDTVNRKLYTADKYYLMCIALPEK
ncbi:MAG: PQQ-binding-like beta-propeller repeat protein [Chitinophagales bacterium]|nr:PQQ-binding-like beta-propeller repeat protein [Chitinophagales bacterium]